MSYARIYNRVMSNYRMNYLADGITLIAHFFEDVSGLFLWLANRILDLHHIAIFQNREEEVRRMGAYEEGYEAFHRGDAPEMNPYDERDGQHDEWNEGYLQADCQESGER